MHLHHINICGEDKSYWRPTINAASGQSGCDSLDILCDHIDYMIGRGNEAEYAENCHGFPYDEMIREFGHQDCKHAAFMLRNGRQATEAAML